MNVAADATEKLGSMRSLGFSERRSFFFFFFFVFFFFFFFAADAAAAAAAVLLPMVASTQAATAASTGALPTSLYDTHRLSAAVHRDTGTAACCC